MDTMVREVPQRDRQQRMSALEKANHVRTWRAERKRNLALGIEEARDLLADPAPEAETWKVVEVLTAMRMVGKVRANQTLTQLRISPSKTVGGLSERQRRELVQWLWR